jgi:hypothetical protein
MKPQDSVELKKQLFHKAKLAFRFLEQCGFSILDERQPVSHDFREGFNIRYGRGQNIVEVRYYAMEFNVNFQNANQKATYFFIDKYLFDNASGCAGCMFPPEKLDGIIFEVANDIEQNYKNILEGDLSIWRRIIANLNAPVTKSKLP